MPPTSLPIGWTQLTNVPEDEIALGTALSLVQASYPANRYVHLDVDKLRRKMVCRKVVLENGGQEKLVLALRVFWRAGLGAGMNMAAFFFARHRQNDPTKRAYCLTLGVGENVTEATITQQMKALCGYMKDQVGGHRQVILDKVDPPQPNPPEKYPVTLRPNLDAAFKSAREASSPSITYKGVIQADPPPWPDNCHIWLLKP